MLQKATCLGVDISGERIRVVEMRRTGREYQVSQAAVLKAEDDDVASAIERFLLETGTQPTCVVCSVPTHLCSVKFADLPMTKPAETARMARYEAESQMPMSLNDLAWGFTTDRPAKGEKQLHTTLAATQQPVANAIASSFETMGYPLAALTVAALAEVRGLRPYIEKCGGAAIVAHVGTEWTDLTTVSDGRIISCRSAQCGTDGLISALATELGVEPDKAGERVRREPLLASYCKPGEPGSPVRDWVGALATEIRRSALAFTSPTDEGSAATVILAGDGAAIQELGDALGKETEMVVIAGDPWASMSLSQVVHHCRDIASSEFTVATGLAIAGIQRDGVLNLVPSREPLRARQRKERIAVTALSAAAAVLAIVFVTGQEGIAARSSELDGLRAEVGAAKRAVPQVDSGVSDTTKGMSQMVTYLRTEANDPVQILRQLSASLPSSCWLTELSFESGGTLVIRGSSLSNSAVADAVYSIANANMFQSVSLDYSNLGSTKGRAIYDFQIKCAPSSDMPVFGSSGKRSAARRATKQ